jgi:hypothetical protein
MVKPVGIGNQVWLTVFRRPVQTRIVFSFRICCNQLRYGRGGDVVFQRLGLVVELLVGV